MYPRMMHPAFIYWWRSRREGADCGRRAGWGHGGHEGGEPSSGYEAGAADEGEYGSGAFGVRRPLRFLAWKLNLSESQVAELARVINELKTERAQAAVDNRRVIAAFADAMVAATFDADKVGSAADQRVVSAGKLKEIVAKALGRIHAILKPEQREKLAYLIRTGTLVI